MAFSNSFAMERHYFNFTTAGQWLWDELQITLPAKEDPYAAANGLPGWSAVLRDVRPAES